MFSYLYISVSVSYSQIRFPNSCMYARDLHAGKCQYNTLEYTIIPVIVIYCVKSLLILAHGENTLSAMIASVEICGSVGVAWVVNPPRFSCIHNHVSIVSFKHPFDILEGPGAILQTEYLSVVSPGHTVCPQKGGYFIYNTGRTSSEIIFFFGKSKI